MLIFNRKDGTVESYDLAARQDLARFRSVSSDPTWHQTVTGASLVGEWARVDLPLPKHFGSVTYDAEVVREGDKSVAERISASAGDAYVTLTMYQNGRSGRFRVDILKPGKRRWRRS